MSESKKLPKLKLSSETIRHLNVRSSVRTGGFWTSSIPCIIEENSDKVCAPSQALGKCDPIVV